MEERFLRTREWSRRPTPGRSLSFLSWRNTRRERRCSWAMSPPIVLTARAAECVSGSRGAGGDDPRTVCTARRNCIASGIPRRAGERTDPGAERGPAAKRADPSVGERGHLRSRPRGAHRIRELVRRADRRLGAEGVDRSRCPRHLPSHAALRRSLPRRRMPGAPEHERQRASRLGEETVPAPRRLVATGRIRHRAHPKGRSGPRSRARVQGHHRT